MSILRIILLLSLMVSSSTHAEQETVTEKDLRELMTLLSGEFNNYNQINFLNNDFLEQRPDTDYSRLHHIREIIDSPYLEGHWLYAQINREDRQGEVYRQVVHNFFIDESGVIRSRVYALSQQKIKEYPGKKKLNSLKLSRLSHNFSEGCDTFWRRELNQFVGITDFNICVIDSKYDVGKQRKLFAEEIVGQRGIWAREGAYNMDGTLAFGLEAPNYYRSHRVRPMKCWAGVHLGDDQWEFYKDLETHDEGGSVTFGDQRQYRLQLKQAEFPATDRSNVFEIFLYRGDEEKAFAYSWTEPSAKQIAVNLREVQASCKVAAD